MNMIKALVCGMMFDPDTSLTAVYQNEYFCSELCEQTFLEDTVKFVGADGSRATCPRENL